MERIPNKGFCEITAHKLKVAVQAALTPLTIEHAANADVVIDEFARRLVARLTAFIAGVPIEPVHWPLDWWQAVKLRWFPLWLLRRYPMQWASAPAYRVCPHLQIPHDKATCIRWLTQQQ